MIFSNEGSELFVFDFSALICFIYNRFQLDQTHADHFCVLNPASEQHSSPVFCGQRLRRQFGKLGGRRNEIANVLQLDDTSPLQSRF